MGRHHFTLFSIFITTTSLVSTQALAGETSECFTTPTDPADCSLRAPAQARLEVLTEELQASFAERSNIDTFPHTVELDQVVSYLSRCNNASCESFRKALVRPLEAGWKQAAQAEFRGQHGQCALQAEYIGKSHVYTSPTGERALTSQFARSSRTWMHLVGGSVPCQREGHSERTSRAFTLSQTGITVLDWGDRRKVSDQWGRRAEIKPPAEPSVSPLNATTLRIQWPNGAYLDLDNTGLPIDSNVLQSSMWGANCITETHGNGRNIYPRMELVPNQTLMHLKSGFIKF